MQEDYKKQSKISHKTSNQPTLTSRIENICKITRWKTSYLNMWREQFLDLNEVPIMMQSC